MYHNLEGCIQESKQYISPNSDYAYTGDTGCLIFAPSVRLKVLASAPYAPPYESFRFFIVNVWLISNGKLLTGQILLSFIR